MPGLHVHRSNRLEVLVQVLAEQIRAPGGDPALAIEVAVGSRGMERWLRQALAVRLGICANLRFPSPAEAIEAALGAAPPDPDPWEPAALTWRLCDALTRAAARPGCEPLALYLAEGGEAAVTGAFTVAFARRLAEIFDRYGTWRPELALAWSSGPVLGWQAETWQILEQAAAGPHRARRLREAPGATPGPPLHVFALSSLAPSWLAALERIAGVRDVELYLSAPTAGHFADEGSAGHPLLASWGRTARGLQRSLDRALVLEGGSELFVDPLPGGPPSALALLQSDLVRGQVPAESPGFASRELASSDRSVQLHDCHSAMRQVEVLRGAILDLLAADPTLEPRDVVVMTPDLDTFAPRFAAVFAAGEAAAGPDGAWGGTGMPRLPYEIADRALRRVDPVADALLRVLALVGGRATASEVLDLLAIDAVSRRFGLTPELVPRVREWATAAGICWAADAGHRAALDQPRDEQNTWRHGLDRLLLGVVCRDDGELRSLGPHEAVEGIESLWIGALYEFAATVFATADALAAPRTVEEWAAALGRAASDLTAQGPDGSGSARRVREDLAALAAEARAARSRTLVSVGGIRAALDGRFTRPAPSFGSGAGIALCGIFPARAVPCRVLCLLGMDDGAFPRGGATSAFDEMALHPRVGDPSPRDDDRGLLLEALLSARDALVVCWSGRDERTNAVRPPAVPISELCEAIDATFPPSEARGGAAARLTTRHTLQPFDPRNFDAAAPRSFDQRLVGGARAARGTRARRAPFLAPGERGRAPPGPDPEIIELEDLCRFWRHPLRSFTRQRLGLWLPYEAREAPSVDREPIELGFIENADLLRDVLDARIRGADPGRARAALRSAGRLPLGCAGDLAFDAVVLLCDSLEQAAGNLGWTRAAAQPTEIGAWLPDGRLQGRIGGIAPRALVTFAYGGERPAELLQTWLRLLAWRAAEPTSPGRAVVLFGRVTGKGESQLVRIGLDAGAAGDHLARLVALRRLGASTALPYLPKTSHRYAAGAAKSQEEAAAKALAAWREESGDSWVRHLFGGQLPFVDPGGRWDERFTALAREVWDPLLAGRRTSTQLAKWGLR